MNKYLEKIAYFTGIEAGILGAVGARKGDRVGGAVSGIGGAMAGGTAIGLGDIALRSLNTRRPFKELAESYHSIPKGHGHRLALTAGMAGGAYLGGKAYSAFKHRND